MRGMRPVRVRNRRTAIVGVTMFDLGIIMDALNAQDECGFEPDTPPEFRTETERLRRQVRGVLVAMDENADSGPEGIAEST